MNSSPYKLNYLCQLGSVNEMCQNYDQRTKVDANHPNTSEALAKAQSNLEAIQVYPNDPSKPNKESAQAQVSFRFFN